MKKAVRRERSISVKQYKESNVAHWLQLNWRRLLRVEVIVFVVLCLILLYNGFQLARCKWMATRPRQAYYKALFDSKKDDIIDFEGFNNRFSTSDQKLIVPNIIHLLFLNQTEMRFHEMICIFSMFLNQKPDTIMIHCENCSFTGYYWNKLNKFKALSSIIKFNTLPVKRGIYGKLSNTIRYALNHRADFWRLMILMKYGGIYLDNDVYVISSLDHYRKFEMTVGMENANSGVTIGNQVILAHRNARLLKAMFDTYRYDYQQNEWYYNGGWLAFLFFLSLKYIIVKERNLIIVLSC